MAFRLRCRSLLHVDKRPTAGTSSLPNFLSFGRQRPLNFLLFLSFILLIKANIPGGPQRGGIPETYGPTNYFEEIAKFSEEGGDFGGFKGGWGGGEGGEESDPLYDEAVRFVTESRKASICSLQRVLKVGYNCAARMTEDMEKAGIVVPAETTGSREVLAPPPPVESCEEGSVALAV